MVVVGSSNGSGSNGLHCDSSCISWWIVVMVMT